MKKCALVRSSSVAGQADLEPQFGVRRGGAAASPKRSIVDIGIMSHSSKVWKVHYWVNS